MKTERRHELQTNALADFIGKNLEKTQGRGKTILALVVLTIAVLFAAKFLVENQAAQSQVGWNQFFLAFGQRDPAALEIVAKGNVGTTAGVWAQLAEADLKLAEGIGDLYTNRDNAKTNLQLAEEKYKAVDLTATEQLLRTRAWFGLGQAYESMSQVEKAKEYYGKLTDNAPKSALGKEAARRLAALEDPDTEKWYNWFANQTPRPSIIPGAPGADFPGNLPFDLEGLPDRPDLSVPDFSSAPGAGTDPAEAEPEAGPELNSPTSDTPESDAPTSDTPTSDTPESETPADVSPEPDAPE